MKVKISENRLQKLIYESIFANIKESIDTPLYNMMSEKDEEDDDYENQTLDDLGLGDMTLKDLGLKKSDVEGLTSGNDSDDESDEDGDEPTPMPKTKKEKKDKDDEEEEGNGVSQIEKYFDKPGVDNAPFAYELFDVNAEEGKDTNDMKNARHLFAAKKNHDLNDNGYPYSFTSTEKNELQNMISSAGLTESKLRLTESELKAIVAECVKRKMNEGFFNFGAKNQQAQGAGQVPEMKQNFINAYKNAGAVISRWRFSKTASPAQLKAVQYWSNQLNNCYQHGLDACETLAQNRNDASALKIFNQCYYNMWKIYTPQYLNQNIKRGMQ